ncbi:MAG: OmpA family protein [Elusimicrobiota bacterium]
MAVYRFRKEELEGHLNRNALWAIVYGDMMSYLMILFLLMLSYNLSQDVKIHKRDKVEDSLIQIQRVFGGEVDPKLAERAQQRDQELLVSQSLQDKVDGGELGEAVKLVVTVKRISLNLGEGVLFDSGNAELTPKALPVLESIAKDMKNLRNQIRIEGHTDNVPIRRGRYRSNWELSMARAYAVIRTLEGSGVDSSRISGVGFGEHRPVADNATAEGRAKNRRIEISLLREE